jgi:hypothetical protein
MSSHRFGTPLLLAARLLAISYGLFVLFFALDVFIPGRPVGAIAIEFIIHAAPSFLLFFCIAISWRSPRLAGILVLACALYFALLFQTYRSWIFFLIFTGIPLISGGLFLSQSRRGVGHNG